MRGTSKLVFMVVNLGNLLFFNGKFIVMSSKSERRGKSIVVSKLKKLLTAVRRFKTHCWKSS